MTTISEAPETLSVLTAPESFFETHTPTLHELFVGLGREAEWRDNPQDLLPYVVPSWLGREHGNSAEKDQFTEEQEAAAKALMRSLGLQEEVVPLADRYEQAIIGGGMMRVNRQRIAFMKELLETGGVETEHIIFWAGQRLRDARDDAQLQIMDLETLATDAWVREQLARPEEPGWSNRFATETGLARLAYLESFGHAKLRRITTEMQLTSAASGIPRPGAARYSFTADGYPGFVLMNGKAVARKSGPPRPTTKSCAEEWLEKIAPSPGAQILIVAGNPHTLRAKRDIQQIARQNGRADINFTVCGPAANPEASIQLYLGEIGALLSQDARVMGATISR
jgi:hypothetical protein